MSAQTRVIINPAAGGGKAGRQWPRHAQTLRDAIGAFDAHFTTPERGAAALAREVAETHQRIIAVGGDGTVNEIVNGLADAKTPPALGIIGVGTGNDFARSLGIKGGWTHGIAALRKAQIRAVDLGVIRYGDNQQRWFANAANLGLISEVVADVQGSPLKHLLGSKLAYPLHAISVLRRYKGHTISFEDAEGQTRQMPVLAVAVSNGRYFGAGMKIAPQAELDDGLLDVIIVAQQPKVCAMDLRLLYAGTHLAHPAVTHFKTRRVTFETSDGSRMLCDADGELLGATPCEIEIHPRKLKVIAAL